jgi:hypothetical protein
MEFGAILSNSPQDGNGRRIHHAASRRHSAEELARRGQRVQANFQRVELLEDLVEGRSVDRKHFLHLHIVVA